ncbi:16S rRNA (guanine(966)-N(2))-methyltransferase RsmD [uncultured Oxalicibacterium sp.]|uniref:16S rRNA (guanine(966)-N(2))-methyltransferase RsmD n=1 Tax=uncultured Oxalicibacterium sp. TaxID=1168540 RepID=UPI0025F4EB68|nr:16S rRNA (guanine(966)-N(2))-methyltransferase RsmD [uncultured Oxalicibacterium sp.]
MTRPHGKSASVKPRNAPHQVRIIGGQWKRTPLPVTDATGLRPTPDRVRETVFNWITHVIDGDWERIACLDAFAGTGVLGFEAASRGARHVVLLENFGPAVRQLAQMKDKLQASQIDIMQGDALAKMQGLQRSQTQFDLIFLDPPYHQNWLERAVPLCEALLRRDGLLYVESEVPLTAESAPAWLANWEILRADKAGTVFYHLLQAKKVPQIEA